LTTVSPSAARQSLQFLKGVGPFRAKALEKLALTTVSDLIHHFPRSYEDRRLTDLRRLRPGTTACVEGTVLTFATQMTGRQLALGKAALQVGAGTLSAVWFRRFSYRYDVFAPLQKQLQPGAKIRVYGLVERDLAGLQIRVEDQETAPAEGQESLHTGRIVPVHDLTEGIHARWLRALIYDGLQKHLGEFDEPHAPDFLEKHGLAPLAWALRAIHFPESAADAEKARRRLAFDEFFLLELALTRVRRQRAEGPPAAPCRPTKACLTPFRNALGFDFTPAQKRVINEIFADMGEPKPMNRLLQGDVGSGKTVVALSAMLLAHENGLQSAFMAPTEILAEQHFLTMSKLLKGLPVRARLVTGSLTKTDKDEARRALAEGAADIAVGTHALLEDDVAFKRLGLAVIDEQHRFGVRQRGKLQTKALAPHALTMTATPIPRTLAMTLYGDLAVSTVRELPPGRPPLTTHWTIEENAWTAVRSAVARGEQAYVVFPLIEESDKLALKAALKEHARLSGTVFKGLSVGLLHGRMKPAEKEAAMARFAKGEDKILVATPVIEVGIDVPNATVIVITDADRFGLSQLHQLRGRVGRGTKPSACYLLTSKASDTARQRLELLCRSRDGFRLSEEDLKIRGPGEFLGDAQHGALRFKAGDLLRDADLIAEARRAAETLLEEDPALARPALHSLRRALENRYAGRWTLGTTA